MASPASTRQPAQFQTLQTRSMEFANTSTVLNKRWVHWNPLKWQTTYQIHRPDMHSRQLGWLTPSMTAEQLVRSSKRDSRNGQDIPPRTSSLYLTRYKWACGTGKRFATSRHGWRPVSLFISLSRGNNCKEPACLDRRIALTCTQHDAREEHAPIGFRIRTSLPTNERSRSPSKGTASFD